MSFQSPIIYRATRSILRTALGFYFRRIERFHRERVPASGPLLFTSNHPNSVTDAFVIGGSVPRKVNFVATVQLFWLAPVCRISKRASGLKLTEITHPKPRNGPRNSGIETPGML